VTSKKKQKRGGPVLGQQELKDIVHTKDGNQGLNEGNDDIVMTRILHVRLDNVQGAGGQRENPWQMVGMEDVFIIKQSSAVSPWRIVCTRPRQHTTHEVKGT